MQVTDIHVLQTAECVVNVTIKEDRVLLCTDFTAIVARLGVFWVASDKACHIRHTLRKGSRRALSKKGEISNHLSSKSESA